MTDVMKCGISSRKTTGRVIDVAYDHFYVAGNEVTPFSFPGDSGSLVLNQKGDALGVVMEVTLQAHQNMYVTKVLPVWIFYGWLSELRSLELSEGHFQFDGKCTYCILKTTLRIQS